MVSRSPYENFWGWVTRPTTGFRFLFFSFTAVFLVQMIFQYVQSSQLTTFNEFFSLSVAGIQKGNVWQLLSYGLLHQDIMHFLLNVFLLYVFAYEVEYQLGLKHFLFLFFIGIATGGALWLGAEHFKTGHTTTILMGSSGGVFGIIFAFITMFPERPVAVLGGLRAKHLGMILTAIAIYFIIFPSDNVAHMAHLGGIFAGITYVKILCYHWRAQIPVSPTRVQLVTSEHRHGERVVSRTEFIHTKVDPILEKIAEKGLESLSEDERRILDEAHDRLSS